MQSIYKNLNRTIQLPKFDERGILYMHKTSMLNPQLPSRFLPYKRAIMQCLETTSIDKDICYVTIDEKTLCNETHRRAGIHVDFNWFENDVLGSHDNHRGQPTAGSWADDPNPTPGWKPRYDENHGGMLLVSSHCGCRVFRGSFEGEIKEGGDCTGIDISGLESEVMIPHQVYFLNALCIHEPLFIPMKVERSLIRINFHPDHVN